MQLQLDMVVDYNIVYEMLTHELQNKDEFVPSNKNKEHKVTPPKMDNLKTDSNIDLCHHSIQEDQQSFELKRAGERDYETFTKNCE